MEQKHLPYRVGHVPCFVQPHGRPCSLPTGDGGGVGGEEGRCQLGTEPEERREGEIKIIFI